MRKTELKGCPQWLLDAHTDNEDVDFDSFGILSWRSGDFLGGDFCGGNFCGGDFRGGNFWGGDFCGGNFRGGNFLGGNFRGGNFLGGDFRGGNFRGGNFWGERLINKPISIYGLVWPVLITGKQMQIGCQRHTHIKWDSFTNKQIADMESRALDFWRENKTFLLSICAHEATLTKLKEEAIHD